MASGNNRNFKVWAIALSVCAVATVAFIYGVNMHDQSAAPAPSPLKSPFGAPGNQLPARTTDQLAAALPQAQQPAPAAQQPSSLPGVLQTSAAKVQGMAAPEAPKSSMMVFYGGPDAPSVDQGSGQSSEQPSPEAIQRTLAKWRDACQKKHENITFSALQIMKSKPLLKAFLNDKIVVQLFIYRLKKQGVYDDAHALIDYAKDSPELAAILGTKDVQNARNDQELLSIVANSRLMSAFVKIPAMQFVTSESRLTRQFLHKNNQMASLLITPEINAALAANPAAADFAQAVMDNADATRTDDDGGAKLKTISGDFGQSQDGQKVMGASNSSQQGGSSSSGSGQPTSMPNIQNIIQNIPGAGQPSQSGGSKSGGKGTFHSAN
jgi:hypothetical protein